MVKLDESQRKELGKALFDVGKLVLAALVLGESLSGASFRVSVFVLGLLIFVAVFIVATLLNKKGESS